MFDDNCIYDLGTNDNFDVNKLFGISFGVHHINSWRLGYNCENKNGTMSLYSYWYNNKKRSFSKLFDITTDKIPHFAINIDRATNAIWIKSMHPDYPYESKLDFDFSKCPKWSYMLYPYFGGNCTAPNRMDYYIYHKR